MHTLYLDVLKKFCSLVSSKSKTDRHKKWSLYNKINGIDQGLTFVKIPTTTSRISRTIAYIVHFKANELRSLMHHESAVLLRAMLLNYRRHFALLLGAFNIASTQENKSDNGSDQPTKSDGIPGNESTNGSDGSALFYLYVLISILVNTREELYTTIISYRIPIVGPNQI